MDLTAIVNHTGFYLMIGCAFLVLFRSGVTHLGLSFQLAVVAITSISVHAVLGDYSVASMLAGIAAGCGAGIAVGWFVVFLRCRFDVNDVFLTLLFAFLTPPLTNGILSFRPSNDMKIATPIVHVTIGFDPPLASLVLGVFVLVVSWWWIERSPAGYEGRALAGNFRILSAADGRRVLMRAAIFSSLIISLAAVMDRHLFFNRYTHGDYDDAGFMAVVVGLPAFKYPLVILLTAGAISFLEALYTSASIRIGVPSYGLRMFYGATIVAVSYWTRQKGDT